MSVRVLVKDSDGMRQGRGLMSPQTVIRFPYFCNPCLYSSPLKGLGVESTLFFLHDTSGNINQNISELLAPHIMWGLAQIQLISRVLTILVKVSLLLLTWIDVYKP